MDLSAGSLFASVLVSAIGIGLFIYGKKQIRPPQLLVGIALMVFPYFVGDPAWMLGTCRAWLSFPLTASSTWSAACSAVSGFGACGG
jgi:predicted cobalt transporter CbtA